MSVVDFDARLAGCANDPVRPAWMAMDAEAFKAAMAATPDRDPISYRGLARPAPLAAGSTPIRTTRRKAADWGAAISRAWSYLAGRIADPVERDKLDAYYEATLAGGPDFAKVRANATFAPVPVVAYNSKIAAEIMRQARKIERETYVARAKGEHGGGLGRMALQLLEWFAFVMWPKARSGMFPSLANIASGSRMSKASVVEAIKKLEAFGFLTIQRRRKRVQTPLGVKVVQDTSSYVLGLAKGLGALALAAFAKGPARRSESSRPSANSDEDSSSLRAKPRPSGIGMSQPMKVGGGRRDSPEGAALPSLGLRASE